MGHNVLTQPEEHICSKRGLPLKTGWKFGGGGLIFLLGDNPLMPSTALGMRTDVNPVIDKAITLTQITKSLYSLPLRYGQNYNFAITVD
ncbi:hypothetical protein MJO28_013999 [Puccinia striiformis f. sp. tritici]|uniref:Uncharacterized protein n=1 Tax=Puccinia striiformis f. sp. tritici TaxID=168172 RepID=A0ACC0DYX8_9BASI|nr:hypothetical protein MJO28_013999 [Puccinia striiformis f. sp. tritici]